MKQGIAPVAPVPASAAPAGNRSRQAPASRTTAEANIAWMTAMSRAAECGEWLAMQGYRLLGLSIDATGPTIRIAPSARALHQLDGANVGRICTGGESRLIYAARRFDCGIKWEETTCH